MPDSCPWPSSNLSQASGFASPESRFLRDNLMLSVSLPVPFLIVESHLRAANLHIYSESPKDLGRNVPIQIAYLRLECHI